MKTIKNFLLFLDIYSTSYKFSLGEKKSHYPSVLGGFLTIMTGVIFIILIFIFGQDFFTYHNPKTISETRYLDVNYTYYYINETNFPIFYQFYNFTNNQPIDMSNILHTSFIYFNITRYNSSIPNYTEPIGIVLNKTNCSENPKIPKFPGIPLNELNCLQYPENNMWFMADNYMTLNTIILMSSLCDSDGNNCKNPKIAREFLKNTKIILRVGMMNSRFIPWNIYEPLKNYITFKDFPLSYNIYRLDNYYINNVKLEDDKGIISKNINVTKSFEISYIESSNVFFSDEDRINNPVLYEVCIYINFTYKFNVRYYMKLQGLFSEAYSSVKIFMAAFHYICSKINPLLMINYFVNLLFENKEILKYFFI
jgi:hypothetical protein